MNRRTHPRFRTKFDVLCSDGEREGAGVIADISRAGVRLEGVSPLPEIGAKVRLYIFIQPVCPFEISGEVVRHMSNDGFAIACDHLDREIGRLVDDIAAVVADR